ncbi:hypothetical protein M422DRAFT_251674 [Sphaerobolus stellatus SS14]|uniref:PARP-type domain-containing protein n=1 Tax=Sphaerobolus stellatus (strain SS14) TaxID=990650 RepID=A0A0C9VDB8_SPHS4|nr:hypothetical protein M422DRAFT_251674 [Sphaerobolus stellatus SS14]
MSDEDTKKPGGYRLEYASSGRAKCKDKYCTNSLTTLIVGLILVCLFTAQAMQWNYHRESAWRHWGCVTPKILSNIASSLNSADDLDGFEDLKDEDKERVRKAVEEGKVADEDVPESAKKTDADGEEAEEKPKRKRAPPKKKAKKDEDEDEDDEEEEKLKKKASAKKAPAKKAPAKKAPAKKVTKKKDSDSEEENFADDIDKISDDEDDDEDAEAGKKRKRPAPKKKVEPKKPAAKKPASRKAKKPVSDDEDDD